MLRPVAVLFARADSIYKQFPDADVWDADRDARNWQGGMPAVAHPPCRAWGAFSMFAKPRPDERDLAPWGIEQVRRFGGVLEHPSGSKLWAAVGAPRPGARERRDAFGGWCLAIHQRDWGHRAQKRTVLYIVGCEPWDLPPVPLQLGEATHVIGDVGRASRGDNRPEVSKREREATPAPLAAWLLDLASRCQR